MCAPARYTWRWRPALVGLMLLAAGCTSIEEYVHNGFKVGPNFRDPPAAVADHWLDADPRLASRPPDDAWWEVFGDPTLNRLIDTAHKQNLDLKTAATRVLEARAQRDIAAGNLFPQTQNAIGDYAHAQLSKNLNVFGNPMASLPTNFNVWATGFNASWEIDFWGRLRRQIEASDADLSASVESYHDALVTLLGDVATNYVQIRTGQERIRLARRNIAIQQGSLALADAAFKAGKTSSLDVEQARTSLAQTEASIPPLVIGVRQANDRLCVLLGLPPHNLVAEFADAPIPAAPPHLAVGVPADLLQRRPDVRRALRDAAAQCPQVGIAQADFLPKIAISGFIGYTSDDIRTLFAENSFTGFIFPNFQWKLLNYGRIANNVKVQDARLQEKILQYQKTVLTAGRETEDALAAFVEYQVQAKSLKDSVQAAERSVELVLAQYKEGRVDFNRVFTTQAQLVTQHDQLAAAQGDIALNLIAVYRALGGGWEYFEKPPPCAHPVEFLTPTAVGN